MLQLQPKFKSLSILLAAGVMVLGYQNCSEVNFASSAEDPSQAPAGIDGDKKNPPGTTAPGDGTDPDYTDIGRGEYPTDYLEPGRCTESLRDVTFPLNMMLVLDASGSNRDSTDPNTGAQVPGTDPEKIFRISSVESFAERFGDKTNFSWGMISFQDLRNPNFNLAKAHIYQAGRQNPVFSNAVNTMSNAVADFETVFDNGYTPYKAAINLSKKAIMNHMSSNPDADETYVVSFITDGMPTDYVRCVSETSGETVLRDSKTCPSGMTDVVDDEALTNDVKSLIALKAGRITFNTVFYGSNNSAKANATWRLKNLAAVGNGQFVDASSAGSIKIEDSIKVPGVVCP